MQIAENRYFYLNRVDRHLWYALVVAVIGYLMLNVSITSHGILFPEWRRTLSTICLAVVTSFIFYVMVVHYAKQKKSDREQEEIGLTVYRLILEANHHLGYPQPHFWEIPREELDKHINVLMNSYAGVNKELTDLVRWKAQKNLDSTMLYLRHLGRYDFDSEFNQIIIEATRHAELVLDEAPAYDTLSFRYALRHYFYALVDLMGEYEFDFAPDSKPFFKKKVKPKDK